MLLKAEWSERFLQACAKVLSARRRSLAAGQPVYLTMSDGRCWVVAAGYVKLLDPRLNGNPFVRLTLGRGDLFGDRPFAARAFRGFASPQHEQAIAHGPAVVLELDHPGLEAASNARAELATLLLESLTTRAQFLERRLLSHFRIDATRFRVRPRNLVNADLKAIHDRPRTDTKESLQNSLK